MATVMRNKSGTAQVAYLIAILLIYCKNTKGDSVITPVFSGDHREALRDAPDSDSRYESPVFAVHLQNLPASRANDVYKTTLDQINAEKLDEYSTRKYSVRNPPEIWVLKLDDEITNEMNPNDKGNGGDLFFRDDRPDWERSHYKVKRLSETVTSDSNGQRRSYRGEFQDTKEHGQTEIHQFPSQHRYSAVELDDDDDDRPDYFFSDGYETGDGFSRHIRAFIAKFKVSGKDGNLRKHQYQRLNKHVGTDDDTDKYYRHPDTNEVLFRPSDYHVKDDEEEEAPTFHNTGHHPRFQRTHLKTYKPIYRLQQETYSYSADAEFSDPRPSDIIDNEPSDHAGNDERDSENENSTINNNPYKAGRLPSDTDKDTPAGSKQYRYKFYKRQNEHQINGENSDEVSPLKLSDDDKKVNLGKEYNERRPRELRKPNASKESLHTRQEKQFSRQRYHPNYRNSNNKYKHSDHYINKHNLNSAIHPLHSRQNRHPIRSVFGNNAGGLVHSDIDIYFTEYNMNDLPLFEDHTSLEQDHSKENRYSVQKRETQKQNQRNLFYSPTDFRNGKINGKNQNIQINSILSNMQEKGVPINKNPTNFYPRYRRNPIISTSPKHNNAHFFHHEAHNQPNLDFANLFSQSTDFHQHELNHLIPHKIAKIRPGAHQQTVFNTAFPDSRFNSLGSTHALNQRKRFPSSIPPRHRGGTTKRWIPGSSSERGSQKHSSTFAPLRGTGPPFIPGPLPPSPYPRIYPISFGSSLVNLYNSIPTVNWSNRRPLPVGPANTGVRPRL